MKVSHIIMIALLSILVIFAIAIIWTIAASNSKNQKKCPTPPNPTKAIYEQQLKCALSKSKPFVMFYPQSNNQMLVVNPNMSQGGLGVESMTVSQLRDLIKGTGQSSNYYFILSPSSTKGKYYLSVDQGQNAGDVLSVGSDGTVTLESSSASASGKTQFSVKSVENVQFSNCSLRAVAKFSTDSKELSISGNKLGVSANGKIALATV